MKYLKKIAKLILKTELQEIDKKLKESLASREILFSTQEDLIKKQTKLEKKLKKFESPENVLLSYYRIDNISSDGLPPSYLKTLDPNEKLQRIQELESVYRNTAFREVMAWSLNFHANIVANESITNKNGDVIEIPEGQARAMIQGVKAVWDLIVTAHVQEQELSSKKNLDFFEENDLLDIN